MEGDDRGAARPGVAGRHQPVVDVVHEHHQLAADHRDVEHGVHHHIRRVAQEPRRPRLRGAEEAVAHLERAAAAHERAGAPALLALTRLALARIGPAARRTALHEAAAATADALGLTRLVEVTTSASDRPVFAREGGLWAVTWRDRVARVPDSKGMGYLAALVGAQGREVGALDLARGAADDGRTRGRRMDGDGRRADGGAPRFDVGAPAQAVLDDRALAAYRTRLAELRTDLADTEADGDPERATRLRTEIDFLAHELGSALGRSGRRRALPTDAERARISVTRALRSAITRIAAADPALGRHLSAAVSTGTYCRYDAHRAGPPG